MLNKELLTKIGFGVLIGVLLFGAWAMVCTKPPLQMLGGIIFLGVLLFPVIELLLPVLKVLVVAFEGCQVVVRKPRSLRVRKPKSVLIIGGSLKGVRPFSLMERPSEKEYLIVSGSFGAGWPSEQIAARQERYEAQREFQRKTTKETIRTLEEIQHSQRHFLELEAEEPKSEIEWEKRRLLFIWETTKEVSRIPVERKRKGLETIPRIGLRAK